MQRPGPAGGEGDAPSRSASPGCNAPSDTARRKTTRPAPSQPTGAARVHARARAPRCALALLRACAARWRFRARALHACALALSRACAPGTRARALTPSCRASQLALERASLERVLQARVPASVPWRVTARPARRRLRTPLCPSSWAKHCRHARACSRALACAPHALARNSVRALRACALRANVLHTLWQDAGGVRVQAWRLACWRRHLAAQTAFLLISAGRRTVEHWRAISRHICCSLG